MTKADFFKILLLSLTITFSPAMLADEVTLNHQV